MKILIVEDDTLLLQGLILAAQTEGYACDGVSTARAAEQCLETGHYSLVVLDLGLPDEDGLHFLNRIRQKKYTVPVLILTARDTLKLHDLIKRTAALLRHEINKQFADCHYFFHRSSPRICR